METERVEFDPATHTYRVKGEVYPSVTQVLKETGAIDARWYTEEARYRGSMVALLTELDDKGRLSGDVAGKFGEYWPYLEAWRAFKADTKFKVERIEWACAHEQYRYAGTIDRTGTLRDRLYVCEIKTGQYASWHRLQTAAYAAIVSIRRRMEVVLEPDGYKVIEHVEDHEDWSAWRSLVNWYNWKKRNG